MIKIRPYGDADWPAVWTIIEPVFRSGETYAFATTIAEDEARKEWVDKPELTFVAEEGEGKIVGTYYLKPNQPALGAHVCNCGYIVAAEARGQGIATQMCEHSQKVALKHGFRAMQYNLVVSTNEGAVRLWQKLGFDIVGRLPGAFKHPRQGYVDAFVMFKELSTQA